MQRAEEVHCLFQGTMELAKTVRFVALIFEVIAAGLVIYGIFSSNTAAIFALGILLTTSAALVLRRYAAQTSSKAAGYRRASIRAFAANLDIDALDHSDMKSGAPTLGTKHCTTKTLAEYYDFPNSDELMNLRAIYAQSAFYTAHLLRAWGTISVIMGFGLAILAGVVIYIIANESGELKGRAEILNALASVVLVLFCARLLDSGWRSLWEAGVVSQIEKNLQHIEAGTAIRNQCDLYDLALVSSPAIPTPLYKLRSSWLKARWKERRMNLEINDATNNK